MHKRTDGRAAHQLRPIKVVYDVFEHAAGSVLYELGKTKVLCAVTLQDGVPPFLRSKKTGWLTAEYAMLPAATPLRTVRESSSGKRNGRTVEISRMIGRVLRSIIQLDHLGEKTIFVDCDVLQADGGTRTACITGASLALKQACTRWYNEGLISEPILIDEIAAISVGLMNEKILLDVDYSEDSVLDADFNIVLTRSGKLVEMQGAAEKKHLTWDQFEALRSLAEQAIAKIFLTLSTDDAPQPTATMWSLFGKEQVSEVEG